MSSESGDLETGSSCSSFRSDVSSIDSELFVNRERDWKERDEKKKKLIFCAIYIFIGIIIGFVNGLCLFIIGPYLIELVLGPNLFQNQDLSSKESYYRHRSTLLPVTFKREVEYNSVGERNVLVAYFEDQQGLEIMEEHPFEIVLDNYCCPRNSDVKDVTEDCRMIQTGVVVHELAPNEYAIREAGSVKSLVELALGKHTKCNSKEEFVTHITRVRKIIIPEYTCNGYCQPGERKKFFHKNQDLRNSLTEEHYDKYTQECYEFSMHRMYFDFVGMRELESLFFYDDLDPFCDAHLVANKYTHVCKADFFRLRCEHRVGIISLGKPVTEAKEEKTGWFS